MDCLMLVHDTKARKCARDKTAYGDDEINSSKSRVLVRRNKGWNKSKPSKSGQVRDEVGRNVNKSRPQARRNKIDLLGN